MASIGCNGPRFTLALLPDGPLPKEFGGVHGHAEFACMAFFDDGMNDGSEFLDRVLGVDDVPDLDVVGIFRGELAHQLAALLGRVDLDDGRITEIELRSRDAGNKRTGDSDARRLRG